MHLRRRHQEQQPGHLQQPYVQKVKRPEESSENTFNWDRLAFPKEIRDLAAARKNLQKKIREIENRLRFGYSEVLNTYKMELVKEDVELCCKMTGYLINLKRK